MDYGLQPGNPCPAPSPALLAHFSSPQPEPDPLNNSPGAERENCTKYSDERVVLPAGPCGYSNCRYSTHTHTLTHSHSHGIYQIHVTSFAHLTNAYASSEGGGEGAEEQSPQQFQLEEL